MMNLEFNNLNDNFEYESPQSLLYKFYRQEPARCPSCGTTYRYFLQTGRFGCARCYETFASQLQKEVLPRMQRSNRYVGRKYGTACRLEQANDVTTQAVEQPRDNKMEQPTDKSLLTTLQKELQQAVQQEKYEKAARLRDQIAELQKGEER